MKFLREVPLDLLGVGLVLFLAAVAFFVMGAFACSAHRYGDAFYEFFVGLISLAYSVACLWKPRSDDV